MGQNNNVGKNLASIVVLSSRRFSPYSGELH